MATLEAFRCVLDDARTPEIIRHHIIDALQYALRNYGQVFTAKEVEWLAAWDDRAFRSPRARSSTGASRPPPRADAARRPRRAQRPRAPAKKAAQPKPRRLRRLRAVSRCPARRAPSLQAEVDARRRALVLDALRVELRATMNIRLESTLPSRYWRTACARA